MGISGRMQRMHNCVGVTIDTTHGFKGQVYNCFKNESDSFSDVNDFYSIVNSFLDTLDYPAQKTKFRAFKKTLPTLRIVDINPDEKLFDTEQLLDLIDDKGFIIMVIGRDNATWQGMAYSKALDKEFSFNSEVELMRILK